MGAKGEILTPPPRVVLDANVVLSALLFRTGRVSWMARAWQSGRLVPLVSRASVTGYLQGESRKGGKGRKRAEDKGLRGQRGREG